MVMITITTKKSTDNKKLKYGEVPHKTCSASTADEMEFNLDFAFLESMSPLMLYTFSISSTRMSI